MNIVEVINNITKFSSRYGKYIHLEKEIQEQQHYL